MTTNHRSTLALLLTVTCALGAAALAPAASAHHGATLVPIGLCDSFPNHPLCAHIDPDDFVEIDVWPFYGPAPAFLEEAVSHPIFREPAIRGIMCFNVLPDLTDRDPLVGHPAEAPELPVNVNPNHSALAGAQASVDHNVASAQSGAEIVCR